MLGFLIAVVVTFSLLVMVALMLWTIVMIILRNLYK